MEIKVKAGGANIYQKILELCPDDWECFPHYLGCLLEDDSSWRNEANTDPIHPPKFVDCKVPHLPDEVLDSRLSSASVFVHKLQADADNGFIKCPYLAILEIARRRHFYGKANDVEIMKSLMQYFCKLGHLACFTSDVEVFLQVLAPDKRMEFVEKLVESSNSVTPVTTKLLGNSISILRIKQMGDIYKPSITELGGSARQMMEMYWKSLPLSKDLDLQESMHAVELLSMACKVLVQLFWKTRHLGYFIEAILILEFGLAIRRHVWQYKILLLHLYSHLGALSLAYEWYKSLDVKNISMETVSHHIFPYMLLSPLWVDLSNLLKDYLRFMDDHLRESADLTFLAYRHRNYSKVIEFVQFKERLQRSNQYLVARVETSNLQLKQKADNIEEEEGILDGLSYGIHFVELSNEIRSKYLNFNEEFQSRLGGQYEAWTLQLYSVSRFRHVSDTDTCRTLTRNVQGPFEGISYCPKENLIKEREVNVLKVIERKSLLPWMIYLSIQSASVSLKENSEVNGSMSEPKISSELKFLLERYAKMLGSSLTDAIEMIQGVSTGVRSSEAFGSDMIDWLNFAAFLNAWSLNTHELSHLGDQQCGHGIWHSVGTLLLKCIAKKARTMESLICSPSGDLPTLVQLVTEPLAWLGLVLQSCVRSLLSSGKKKKGVSTEHSTSLLSCTIRDSIDSYCGIVEGVAKSIREQINKPDEILDIILSSLKKKGKEEGPGQVFQILESFITSVDDVELGGWISQAVKSWSPVDVARKIVTGSSTVLSKFLHICESRIKLLQALKQQISQV